MIALKTVIFTVLVPGTVWLYVPYVLRVRFGVATFDIGAWRYTGLALFAAGLAAYGWCAFDFTVTRRGTPAPIDPPKRFVAVGLYRIVRNPMYVGGLLIILGQSLYFQAAVLLAYAAALFAAFHLFVVLYEEPALRRTFGPAYIAYCARVPRWIPRMKPVPSTLGRSPRSADMHAEPPPAP